MEIHSVLEQLSKTREDLRSLASVRQASSNVLTVERDQWEADKTELVMRVEKIRVEKQTLTGQLAAAQEACAKSKKFAREVA